jgi:hypothetical protein
MRLITSVIISLFSCFYAAAEECPVETDSQLMYSIFHEIAFKENDEEPGTYTSVIPQQF